MFLPLSKCIICHDHIAKVKYNLKSTYSEKSKVLLIKLVEKLYENIVFLHCNICTACYELLNELDTIQQREKQLYEQLNGYFSKLESSGSKVPKNNKTAPEDAARLCPDFDGGGPEASTDSLQIGDIDFKKLPIKVTRVKTKNDEKFPQETTEVDLEQQNKHNDKAFEQVG